jgi:hypothetical protein
MADENVAVNINLKLDEAAKARVIAGISSMGDEIQKAARKSSGLPETGPLSQFYNPELYKIMTEKVGEGFSKTGKVAEVTALKAGKNWEKFWIQYAKQAEVAQRKVQQYQNQMLVFTSRELKNVSDAISIVSRAAIATGGAITGGVFGLAFKYVKDAKEATALTRAWTAETDKLKDVQNRAGKVMAEVALPTLRKAAQLAEIATSFIEKHPEIVQAALNTGLVLAGLGAVGLAVSKGIKLVADAAYILGAAGQVSAAELQMKASLNQLAAAGIQSKTSIFSGIGIPGKAALSAGAIAAGPIVAVVASILGGLALGGWAYDMFAKFAESKTGKGGRRLNELATGFGYMTGTGLGVIAGKSDTEIERKALVFAAIIGKLTGAIDENSPLWVKAANSVAGAGQILERVAGQIKGSDKEQEIVDAFMKYQEGLADLERDTARKRLEIVRDAAHAIADAERERNQRVQQIIEDYNDRVADITRSYEEARIRAEQDYILERQKIEEDASVRQQEIREDLAKKLQQIELDHRDRVYDLASARDALGLVREQRDYNRKRQEAIDESNDALAKLKADTRRRLDELDRRHQIEAQRRFEDYQRQLAEAAEQEQKQLAEAQEAYNKQIAQIRENEANKLRELELAYREQQIRLREAFTDELNDLDATLLNEKNLKSGYYTLMLQDAQAFVDKYRSTLGGLSNITPPGRSLGGYTSGLVRTGEAGLEYVLNAQTTRAMERLLGGRITQHSLLMKASGGSSGIVWNDQRRFSGEYTGAMRRQVQRDSENAVLDLFGGAA